MKYCISSLIIFALVIYGHPPGKRCGEKENYDPIKKLCVGETGSSPAKSIEQQIDEQIEALKKALQATNDKDRKVAIENHAEILSKLKENWDETEVDSTTEMIRMKSSLDQVDKAYDQVEKIVRHQLANRPDDLGKNLENLKKGKETLATEATKNIAKTQADLEKIKLEFHQSLDRMAETTQMLIDPSSKALPVGPLLHASTSQPAQIAVSITPEEETQKFYDLADGLLKKAKENAINNKPSFDAQVNHARYVLELGIEWGSLDFTLSKKEQSLRIDRRVTDLRHHSELSSLRVDKAEQAKIETQEKKRDDELKQYDNKISGLHLEREQAKQKYDEFLIKFDTEGVKIGYVRDGGSQSAQPKDTNQEPTCYFKEPGPPKSPYETVPQSKLSDSGPCDQSPLRKIRDLLEEDCGELAGATHCVDLLFSTCAAEFNNDYSHNSPVLDRYVCEWHWKTCTSQLTSKRSGKVMHMRKFGQCVPQCMISDKRIWPIHNQPVPGVRTLSKLQSFAILIHYNILIPAKIPVCSRHLSAVESLANATPQISRMKSAASELTTTTTKSPAQSNDFCNSDESESEFFDDYAYCSRDPDFIPDDDDDFHHEISEELREKFYEISRNDLNLDRVEATKRYSDCEKVQMWRRDTIVDKWFDIASRIMAPYESEMLKSSVLKRHGCDQLDENLSLHQLLTRMVCWFRNPRDREERLHILGVIANTTRYQDAVQYLPDLTQWAYYNAKRQYDENAGPKVHVAHKRAYYNKQDVLEFIYFMCSPLVTVGLPYGVRRVKTDSCGTVEIPNTIRKLRDASVIRLYHNFLEFNGQDTQKAMSDSTISRILNWCPATPQLTQACVNYFIADGEEGFDTLHGIVDMLKMVAYIDQDTAKQLHGSLHESEDYIGGDYKVHLKELSKVADHSLLFALSDPNDPSFQAKSELDGKNHQHNFLCSRCQFVDSTFDGIKRLLTNYKKSRECNKQKPVTEAELEEIEDKLADLDDAVEKITEMKRHFVRAARSQQARADMMKKASPTVALATVDWAQKLDPLYFHETQRQYFGKSGLNIHIVHVIIVDFEGKVARWVFVHFFAGESQDAETVTSIIPHVTSILSEMGVEELGIRWDNAGCYKSSGTISTLLKLSAEKKLKVKIGRISFSEPQDGKSDADRDAALIKNRAREYVKVEKKKIETPEDLMKAMQWGEKLEGFSFYVAELERPAKKVVHGTISEISKLHEFHLLPSGSVQVWRHWNVGEGKELKTKDWKTNDGKLKILQKYNSPDDIIASAKTPEEKEKIKDNIFVKIRPRTLKNAPAATETEADSEDDSGDSGSTVTDGNDFAELAKLQSQTGYINCPVEGCTVKLRFWGYIENHLQKGNHKFAPQKCSLKDFAIGAYKETLEGQNEARSMDSAAKAIKEIEDGEVGQTNLKMGWANAERKVVKRYSNDQYNFLNDLFIKGQKTGSKIDPKSASDMMKKEKRSDGKKRFTRDEQLSTSQIRGWFSQRARKENELQQKLLKQQGSRTKREVITDELLLQEMNKELEELEGDFRTTEEIENFWDDPEEILEEMISKNREEIFVD